MTEKAKEKSKKKRSISSFTILLIILIVLALVTVVMSLAGVEGVQGATVANVATAPVKGFTDALPVCLFVLILGGFLGYRHGNGRAGRRYRSAGEEAQGQ